MIKYFLVLRNNNNAHNYKMKDLLNTAQKCFQSTVAFYCDNRFFPSIKTIMPGYGDRLIKLELNLLVHLVYMSRVIGKLTSWFPTWSDTNQAVQLQKMVCGLKFRI